MYEPYLMALVWNKKSDKTKIKPFTVEVMEIRYKIVDNTLWLTDHQGSLLDFDLNEYNVEIASIPKNNRKEEGEISTVKDLMSKFWCVFENRLCGCANNRGDLFTCDAIDDDDMPCRQGG